MSLAVHFQPIIAESSNVQFLSIGRCTPQKENQYSVVKERRQKRIRSESEANFSINIFNHLKVTSFLPIKTPGLLSLSSPPSLFLHISHQNLINPKKDI